MIFSTLGMDYIWIGSLNVLNKRETSLGSGCYTPMGDKLLLERKTMLLLKHLKEQTDESKKPEFEYLLV